MEVRFYANFLGQWCEINSDPEALINGIPILIWLQKMSPISAETLEKGENGFKGKFVDITYKGLLYTISQHSIQIIR